MKITNKNKLDDIEDYERYYIESNGGKIMIHMSDDSIIEYKCVKGETVYIKDNSIKVNTKEVLTTTNKEFIVMELETNIYVSVKDCDKYVGLHIEHDLVTTKYNVYYITKDFKSIIPLYNGLDNKLVQKVIMNKAIIRANIENIIGLQNSEVWIDYLNYKPVDFKMGILSLAGCFYKEDVKDKITKINILEETKLLDFREHGWVGALETYNINLLSTKEKK